MTYFFSIQNKNSCHRCLNLYMYFFACRGGVFKKRKVPCTWVSPRPVYCVEGAKLWSLRFGGCQDSTWLRLSGQLALAEGLYQWHDAAATAALPSNLNMTRLLSVQVGYRHTCTALKKQNKVLTRLGGDFLRLWKFIIILRDLMSMYLNIFFITMY